MLYRNTADFERVLKFGQVISIHHKPDPNKGGLIYEGTPSDFKDLIVVNGFIQFTRFGEEKKFPLTEVASVGTVR